LIYVSQCNGRLVERVVGKLPFSLPDLPSQSWLTRSFSHPGTLADASLTHVDRFLDRVSTRRKQAQERRAAAETAQVSNLLKKGPAVFSKPVYLSLGLESSGPHHLVSILSPDFRLNSPYTKTSCIVPRHEAFLHIWLP
jgi:hypothetical protein